MKTLDAHEMPLAKIFGDDYVFEIPGYQRPYSWTEEQAGELLGDLLDFMEANQGDAASMPPYFLGSIVLIKGSDSAEAQVVDGQQRLTTLTLLLAAIRHQMADQEQREDISALLYEKGNWTKGTENRYRLSLREKDRAFFRDHVQMESGFASLLGNKSELSDSQKLLRGNAVLFDKQLRSLKPEVQQELVQFMMKSCFLVAVSTPNLESAFRIFSVMNSRGLDLSATDILKSKITSRIPAEKQDEYTKKWEDLEETLGRDGFADLFSHIRMIYRKAKPQGTLLKEFQEHVDLKDPVDFMDRILAKTVEIFREIREIDSRWPQQRAEINEILRWLDRIPFKDWVPPTLVFIYHHENEPEAVGEYLRDLERLVYSMLIRKSGINERIDRFSKLTKAVQEKRPLSAENSPLQLTHEEIRETLKQLDGPIYSTHSARSCATLLLRLDSLLSSGGATYNHKIITVEHVLPQNPVAKSKWVTWFPEPQVRQSWVHRLGNLGLLSRSKNSAAKNYEFDKKKELCFKKGGVSPFALTTQIISHEEWRPEIVIKRQQLLMDLLRSHWRLVPSSTPAAAAVPAASP